MFEKICKAINDVTGISGVTLESDFVNDLGLNSFDVVNIIGVFEDEYGIKIKTRDIWKLRKVKDVVVYLERITSA